jgi:hypothetical protein
MYKHIRYNELLPHLIKATQTQQTQINDQQKQIDDLKEKIELLLTKI